MSASILEIEPTGSEIQHRNGTGRVRQTANTNAPQLSYLLCSAWGLTLWVCPKLLLHNRFIQSSICVMFPKDCNYWFLISRIFGGYVFVYAHETLLQVIF